MTDQKPEPRQAAPREKAPPTPPAEVEPGATATGPRPLVVVVSLLGLGALFFSSAWQRDFWSEGELRVATMVKEMVERGDWVVPTIGGEPELRRPPLVPWLSAAADWVASGDPCFTYRLPAVVFALVSLAVTWWLGRALFSGGIGFVAMLIQASTFSFFARSTWLGGDVIFATFCQLAVAGFALATRTKASLRWALLGWFALAGAALSKGLLLGPILVFGSVLGFLFVEGRVPGVLRGWSRLRMLPGLGLFAFLVAPWYVALYLRAGAEALTANLPSHLGLVADSIRESRPAYLHVARGVLGFLPWTLAAPSGLYFAKDRLKEGGKGLCFVAILFPLILLSAVPGKEPGDALFVWPFLSLLIAASLRESGHQYSLWEDYLRIGAFWALRVALVVPLLVIGPFAAVLAFDVATGEGWLTRVVSFILDLFGAAPAGGENRLSAFLGRPGELVVPVGALVVASVVAFFYSFKLQRRMTGKEYTRGTLELCGVTLCLFTAAGFVCADAGTLVSSRGFVRKVEAEVRTAPLLLYGSRPSAFYYYLSSAPEYLEMAKPAGGEASIERLREYAARTDRVYIVASKRPYDLLRRDYPTLTARLKEVDRGYLDWSEEMVLLSNRP